MKVKILKSENSCAKLCPFKKYEIEKSISKVPGFKVF